MEPSDIQPIGIAGPPYTVADPEVSHDPHYWQKLGEFVEFYALTEELVFGYFTLITQINTWLSRAVFPGVRTDVLLQYIRKVWVYFAPPTPLAASLDATLSQIKIISETRNLVIHYSSTMTVELGRVASDEGRAFDPTKTANRPHLARDFGGYAHRFAPNPAQSHDGVLRGH